MPRSTSTSTKPEGKPAERPAEKTWHGIRQSMKDSYGKWYTDGDLRSMEIKWRRIFAETGFNVKDM